MTTEELRAKLKQAYQSYHATRWMTDEIIEVHLDAIVPTIESMLLRAPQTQKTKVMPDTLMDLRAKVEQALTEAAVPKFHHHDIMDEVMPVVEQAIREERKERDADEEAANRDVGEIMASYEKSLAEKDAHIIKLTAFIENLSARGIEEVSIDEFTRILER